MLTSNYIGNPGNVGGEGTIEGLLDVLSREPLDPRFEDYGNFVLIDDEALNGRVRVWGNFFMLSFGFSVDGTRDELAPLIEAIRANQATEGYAAAKAEHQKHADFWEKRQAQREEEDRKDALRRLRSLTKQGRKALA